MLGTILRSIKETPVLNELYRQYTELKIARPYRGKSIRETFSHIYSNHKWGSEESVSGSGSDLSQTATIIKEIPELIERYNIQSLLDVPCGDFNWMKEINLSKLNYTGGDIVPQLIIENNRLYGEKMKRFISLDLVNDDLPKADLILVRDCFVHLPLGSINQAIKNIKNAEIKYILTTTFPRSRRNYDITTGNWRPLNLCKEPFSFGKPIEIINENCTESFGQYNDKSLGLWSVEEIKNLH